MASILVVEDEKDVATLVKFVLELDNHEVRLSSDGAEALEALGLDPASAEPVPDLVLLDIMMPILDGHALLLRMAQEPRTRSVPVVVLTGRSEMRRVVQSSPNVAAYLQKPFDPNALRQAVAKALQAPR